MPDLQVGLTGVFLLLLRQVLRVHLLGVVQRPRRVGGTRALVDADRPDDPALKDANQLQANHLEQREERDDQARARVDVLEQILEPAGFRLRQPRQQLLDPILDRNLLGRQVHLRPRLCALDDGPEGADQAEEIDLDLRLRRLAGDLGDRPVGARPLRAAQRLALVQQLRGRLELLVFEQPAHQRLARILFRIFLRRIRTRQEHPRLDVNQRRSHHEELARHVEVQLLHQIDVGEVLLGDEGDRNVVDVDLVLLDEVQQQIERSLEILQADRIRLENGFELLFHSHHARPEGRAYWYRSFTASRTRSMVSQATTRAFFDPS